MVYYFCLRVNRNQLKAQFTLLQKWRIIFVMKLYIATFKLDTSQKTSRINSQECSRICRIPQLPSAIPGNLRKLICLFHFVPWQCK